MAMRAVKEIENDPKHRWHELLNDMTANAFAPLFQVRLRRGSGCRWGLADRHAGPHEAAHGVAESRRDRIG